MHPCEWMAVYLKSNWLYPRIENICPLACVWLMFICENVALYGFLSTGLIWISSYSWILATEDAKKLNYSISTMILADVNTVVFAFTTAPLCSHRHAHQPRVNISQRLLQNTELSWEEINYFTRKTISICAKRYSLNPPWVSLNITSIHPVGSKHQTQRTPGDQQKYPVYYVWCSIPSVAHKRWKKARKWWC